MFYSQTIAAPKKENVCAKCEKHFSKWSDYHEHTTTTTNCHKVIRPINTSGRTKSEIVKAWELQNREVLI